MLMPWFRFYTEALDDPKVQRLPGDLFKSWVNILCIASESVERGTLPTLEDIAFRLRLDEQKAEDAIRGLMRAKLIDEDEDGAWHIHGWAARQPKSDQDGTANERKRRQRDRERDTQKTSRVTSRVTSRIGHEPVTVDVTRLEQNREEQKEIPIGVSSPSNDAPSNPPPPSGGESVHAVPKPTTLNAERQARFNRWYKGEGVPEYGGYPNKQHRPEAEKAWHKLDPDDELTDRLILDVQQRRGGRKWSEDFVEHPATYLNQRVWEDDIEPIRIPGARYGKAGQADQNAGKRGRLVL